MRLCPARSPWIVIYLLLSPLVGASTAGAQHVCPAPEAPPEGDVEIDLQEPHEKWLDTIDVGEPTLVVVQNVNPFSGRYKLIVGKAQLLPEADPAETILKFLQFAYPGFAGGGMPWTPLIETEPVDTVAPSTKCTAANLVLADHAVMTGLHGALQTGLATMLESADVQEEAIASGSRELRLARTADAVCKRADNLFDIIDNYRSSLSSDVTTAQRARLQLEALAKIVRTGAEKALEGDVCSDSIARVRLVEAATAATEAAAAAAAAKPLLDALGQRSAQLDTMQIQLDEVRADRHQFYLVAPVPLQLKPADVDVEVQRAPLTTKGDEGFRTIATRRIRFEKDHPFDAGIGVAALVSWMPHSEFKARPRSIPGGGTGEDVEAFEVAVADSGNVRFLPTVVATVGFDELDWLSLQGGVGVDPTGKPEPHYLFGVALGNSPFRLSLMAAWAEVTKLDDDLRIGSVILSESDLAVRKEMQLGAAIGLTFLVR